MLNVKNWRCVMMKRWMLIGLLGAMAWTANGQTQTAEVFEQELVRKVKFDYLLNLPEGYEGDKDKKWPLMLFLHGSGERGTDVNKVKVHGPPKVAAAMKLPFVIVSPQCPPGTWWNVEALSALLDEV